MTNTPLNPDDEARLKKALEQSANGQVVSRGSFAQYAQNPLNPDAVTHAKAAAVDCRINGGSTEDVAECAVEAYLAVAQPEVNSVEELATTHVGRALANAAFNEGMSAGIRACNDSLDGEPFVKPVSPYRPESS